MQTDYKEENVSSLLINFQFVYHKEQNIDP
jgi:hypothetical protein